VLDLRPVPYDHPDALRLVAEVQQVYVDRYGGEDVTPVDPCDFAPPTGYFVVGYVVEGGREVAVACGGWRARDEGGDAALRRGDAELKRMYVVARHRGRGLARALLAELERSAAAAGRSRLVLETGTRQPEAMALYTGAGYVPVPAFGAYRCSPDSRCYGKPLAAGPVLDPGADLVRGRGVGVQ
jgi:GNAT superfamily N-acetyltransferase